jgi:hypothetical protein
MLLAVAVLSIALLAPAPLARASDDEVRVAGSCGGGATAVLGLRADDGFIRVRLRVDSGRAHARWHVAIVREGRLVWRGRAPSDGGGSLDVARRIRDLRGADRITARALGPHGITCIAEGTLPAWRRQSVSRNMSQTRPQSRKPGFESP